MKNTTIGFILLLSFCHLNLLAETVYIDDASAIIWSRTGPSTSHKVKYKLPPGIKLDILQKDDASGFSQVKDGRGRVSWIESSYLTTRVSTKELLSEANQKIAQLEKRYTDKVSSLEKRLNELEPLQEINKEVQAKLVKLELDNEMLKEENQMHESGFNRDAFFAGAAVILGGIFIGWLVGRTSFNKRKDGWS